MRVHISAKLIFTDATFSKKIKGHVRTAFHIAEHGITVGGQVVNMIKYADDKAVVCNSQKNQMQKKTKVMCISCRGITKMKIYIDGKLVDQVTQFRYLGSLITEDGYCEKEIRSRIGMAKKIFQDKKKLFIGKMNLELKKRIIKCLVWTVECSSLCGRNVDPSG